MRLQKFSLRSLRSLRSLLAMMALLLGLQVSANAAGGADIRNVDARQTAPETWYFSVTVAHPDTGWDHYVDGWDVVLPDGTVIKPAAGDEYTRVLWHPHVDEQPFTRSQGGIKIPSDVKSVTVRAHLKPDGFVGKTVEVNVTPK